MHTVQRPRFTTRARSSRLALASAVLLGALNALPASAGQDQPRQSAARLTSHGLEIGWVKQPRSPKLALAKEPCPGPLDMVHATPLCEGALQSHVEVDTLPRPRGSGIALPAPVAEQGSPLDGTASGDMLFSGFNYTWHDASASYTFGLLDTSGFIDTSNDDEDESVLFQAPSLVGNPTIQFPDDSLGGGLYWPGNARRPGLSLALTSSHGLGDNPKASYGELINVTDHGKGVFVGAELEWRGRTSYRLGAWTNTAANPRLDGNGKKANYGLYGAAHGSLDKTHWSLRAGVANRQVSAAAWFMSAAIDHDLGLVTAGLGTAVTGASRELGPGTANNWVSEFYLVHELNGSVHIRPHLQYQRNPGFDTSGAAGGRGQWIASLQSNVVF